MNKKFSLSKTALYLILLMVVLIVYVFVYFIPAQSQMAMLRSEISLYSVEAATYRQYLEDPSLLEADIQAVEDEIQKLYAEGYTNDSNVSFEISTAVQRYNISLSSVSLKETTIFEDHKVLPITLTMTGSLEAIQEFIAYFETNQDGSYLVRSASINISGNVTSASLLIYLCTPNV